MPDTNPTAILSVPLTQADDRPIELKHGRKLTVASDGGDQLLEIRGASGVLELRVKVTDQGVVLQMESVHISLKAAESVNVECKDFNVKAENSVSMDSKGDMKITGHADVRVNANGEVRVTGAMIYLN